MFNRRKLNLNVVQNNWCLINWINITDQKMYFAILEKGERFQSDIQTNSSVEHKPKISRQYR